MVQRINLEPTLFENYLEIAKNELMWYMYLVSKSSLNKQLDIVLTFSREDFENMCK